MKTILQVEDDPNDVFFLQHAMKKAGVANPIHVVTDGQQAIDYLQGAGKFADREQFPLPCLVLLDLKLPYVMGLEVLKWIRQQSGMAVVVVLLTASGEEADIAAAYRLGANGFLVKPSEASKLEGMVKAIKDFWLTHNTLPQATYREQAPAPAHSRAVSPAAKHLPGVISTVREEGNPILSKQTYENNHHVSL
jgi:CheY-like chemotaxis protein